jgi:glycosyltransferase involved in cell wall biosynthesis
VLGDPALAGRLREAGRARAEIYSWDRVTDQVESIYAEVAGTR